MQVGELNVLWPHAIAATGRVALIQCARKRRITQRGIGARKSSGDHAVRGIALHGNAELHATHARPRIIDDNAVEQHVGAGGTFLHEVTLHPIDHIAVRLRSQSPNAGITAGRIRCDREQSAGIIGIQLPAACAQQRARWAETRVRLGRGPGRSAEPVHQNPAREDCRSQ